MADTVCVCRNRGLWRKGSQECGKTFSIVHAQLAFGLRDILRRGPDQPLGFVVLGVFLGFQFVHSPTFPDGPLCAGGMAPDLLIRQQTRPIISVPGRVRNISCATESVLSLTGASYYVPL